MKIKTAISSVLIMFVVVSAAYLVFGGSRNDEDVSGGLKAGEKTAVPPGQAAGDSEVGTREQAVAPGSGTQEEAVAPGSDTLEQAEAAGDTVSGSGHSVVAYYFRTTQRCPTCIKIETYTRESLENNFRGLLDSGGLVFRTINVEEAGNEHYIEEYQLTTKSVVIVDYRDGERVGWKNLEKVWEYTYNKELFEDYVRDETKNFLGELIHE